MTEMTVPTHEEKLRQVIRLGMQMRVAQRKYFRTRDRADLVLSKRLEKEYDAAAEALFGTPGASVAAIAEGSLL
jgi:hypothetical protein